jgi:hypothetical protein
VIVHFAVASISPPHSTKIINFCAIPVLQAFAQFKVLTLCLRTTRGAFADISMGIRSNLALFVSVIDVMATWLALALPDFCRRYSAPERVVRFLDSVFSRWRLAWFRKDLIVRKQRQARTSFSFSSQQLYRVH